MNPWFGLTFLFVLCFSLSAMVDPWYQNWSTRRQGSASLLSVLLGDSRRLFANHFFAKADAYFHSGYYPSIFDKPKQAEKSHMTEPVHTASKGAVAHHEGETAEEHAAHATTGAHHPGETAEEHAAHPGHEAEEGADFLGQPRDWIDRFGRHFYASSHSHLEQGGEEREILPWLKFAAELDPQRIDTYIVASYWLRERLGKVTEAEQFLREGLRANPASYEILLELGRLNEENRHDANNARNLYELGLRKWMAREEAGAKPDPFIFQQLLGHLARLEEREQRFEPAIFYLIALKKLSPMPEEIERQIQELKAEQARKAAAPQTP